MLLWVHLEPMFLIYVMRLSYFNIWIYLLNKYVGRVYLYLVGFMLNLLIFWILVIPNSDIWFSFPIVKYFLVMVDGSFVSLEEFLLSSTSKCFLWFLILLLYFLQSWKCSDFGENEALGFVYWKKVRQKGMPPN